jgi:hypothetical protein
LTNSILCDIIKILKEEEITMTILDWTIVTIGLVASAIELGIMVCSLVNYIRDKIIDRQIEKEMLKEFKK